MARLLKKSTAFTFRIGPFVDSTDGVTAETGLTIAQGDIQISKDGGAFAQTSDATPTTTHDTDGWYQCPLTATDTDTLGPLTVQIVKSGALPVWEHFLVVPANVYDALVDDGDKLQVDATQVGGQTASATGTVDFDDIAAILTDTGTTLDDLVDDLESRLTAARAGYLDNLNIGENVAGTSEITALNDPTAATIADSVWDEAVADHNSGGSFGQFIRQIKEGSFIREGTAQAGANGSITLDSSASATDDFYNHTLILLTGGTGAGQVRLITDYTGSSKVASVGRNWTTNPDNTSEFFIIAFAEIEAKSVIDRVTANTDQIEGSDATDQIRDALVDDATRFSGADIAAILTDTGEIGAAGAGLTEAGSDGDHLSAIPWNASWDSEVQSEVNDALVALGLDHLLNAAVSGTDITDDSIIAQLVSASATADWDDFDNTTDALEALRDHIGDGTNLTEAGGDGDHLTEAGGTGDQFTGLPEVSADVTKISGDATAADNLEALMDGVVVAQVNDASATTTAFATDGFTETTDDHFNGRLITFITGNLAGQQTDITDYDAAGGTQGSQELTVTALTEAPANDDFFVIH